MDYNIAAWEALKQRGTIEALEATKYTRLTEKGWFFRGLKRKGDKKKRKSNQRLTN